MRGHAGAVPGEARLEGPSFTTIKANRERQASRGLRATALDRGVHVQCGHSREPIPVSGPHEAQQPQEKGWLDHTCDKHHSWCEAPGGAERQEGAWSAQSRGASYVEVLEPHSPGGWSGFTPAEATPQELSLSGVRVNLSGSGRPGKVAQANSPHQGSVWPWLREVTAMAARGGGSWAHPTARPRTSRDWKNRPSKRGVPWGVLHKGEGSPALLTECRRTVLRVVSDGQADEAGPRVELRVRLGVTGRRGLGRSQEDLVPL